MSNTLIKRGEVVIGTVERMGSSGTVYKANLPGNEQVAENLYNIKSVEEATEFIHNPIINEAARLVLESEPGRKPENQEESAELFMVEAKQVHKSMLR